MKANTYTHNQPSGATNWTVTHNLDKTAVICDVYININGDIEKVMPQQVHHTSNNSLTIVFPTAQTGYARVVG